MKPLDMATNEIPVREQPAELVVETVSMVMRAVKHEMRRNRPEEMSIQQFRVLGIVKRHPGASLSLVARHLGLTTASASKLVDGLVKQELLTRTDSPEDRRKVVLEITEAGNHALEAARAAALGRLTELLEGLCEEERLIVVRAMEILRLAVANGRDNELTHRGRNIS